LPLAFVANKEISRRYEIGNSVRNVLRAMSILIFSLVILLISFSFSETYRSKHLKPENEESGYTN
jgi:hypothetical protein